MRLSPDLELRNFILCEDIRQEITNKIIMIGVYSGDILISNLPGSIPLCMYAELDVKAKGEYDVYLRMSGPGEGSFILQTHIGASNADNNGVIRTPRIDVTLECEGVLKIDASIDRKKWKALSRKKVTQSDEVINLQPTIAAAPPS